MKGTRSGCVSLIGGVRERRSQRASFRGLHFDHDGFRPRLAQENADTSWHCQKRQVLPLARRDDHLWHCGAKISEPWPRVIRLRTVGEHRFALAQYAVKPRPDEESPRSVAMDEFQAILESRGLIGLGGGLWRRDYPARPCPPSAPSWTP